MANKFASIAVQNLTTNDPWADKFYVTCWGDPGHTQQHIGTIQSNIRNKQQADPIIFNGLTLGQTYYLTAQTLISSTGIGSPVSNFSLVAGDSVPPSVTYSYASQTTVSGLHYTITPVSYPSDIDHYEAWWSSDGSTPSSSSSAMAVLTPNQTNGHLDLFIGSGGGVNLTVWVRAFNTSGVSQTWQNLQTQLVPLQTKISVTSVGQYAVSTYGTGSFLQVNDVTQNFGGFPAFRGFNVVGIRKSDGGLDFFKSYDVGSNAGVAAAMSGDMLGLNNHIVIVYAYLDASTNRLSFGLDSTMYSFGASRQVFGSANYKVCSAYILIGERGIGQGNGIEVYSGASDLSVNSYCTTDFYIANGNALGYNATYPPSVQMDPTMGDVSAKGSMPIALANGFTYFASTHDIELQWNLDVYRSDLSGTTMNYQNQEDTTGLQPATAYTFYPYIDEPSNTVQFVYQGGTGANAGEPSGFAHIGTNNAWLQLQSRIDRIPLSTGPMLVATTAAGTANSISGTGGGSAEPGYGQSAAGGGSGGGSGYAGTCLHEDTWVLERDRRHIQLKDLNVGDQIDSPQGWVEVTDVSKAEQDVWIYTRFSNSECFLSTPGHKWMDEEDKLITSAEMTLETFIPTRDDGATTPEAISVSRFKGVKVRVTVGSKQSLFYIGRNSPTQTHNALMMYSC